VALYTKRLPTLEWHYALAVIFMEFVFSCCQFVYVINTKLQKCVDEIELLCVLQQCISRGENETKMLE